MILRRVIAHFRKQEWTAIFLDFLVVVAGVFLANQVTTWKDEAALAKRKAAAIERLHDESESVVDYFSGVVRLFEKNNADAAAILARLSSGDIAGADPEAADAAVDSLNLAPAAAPPRSAYDEMIGAGLFAEIGDVSMRAAVADYYASLAFLQGQIDYVRGAINVESAQRRFKGLSYVYDPAAFRSARIEVDLAALGADAEFMHYATLLNADQIALRQWWTLTLIKARAMCDELARFDGRPCAPKASGDGAEIFGAPPPAEKPREPVP